MEYQAFAEAALILPYTETCTHFDRIGFRVKGKRMFATCLEKDHTANIFLAPSEQKLFCEADAVNIFPVPNRWGLRGWTTFMLDFVSLELVQEALHSAYQEAIKGKKE